DRGSAHIVYQERLLHEEHERWGCVYEGTDPMFIEREEREYAQADCVVAPSSFARASYLEMGLPAERVRTIPQCVRLGHFRKVAEPARDEFSVLFVGQISLRKGIPYLLEAFAQLGHPRKRLRLLGSVQPELRRLFRERRHEQVEVVDRLSREQLI